MTNLELPRWHLVLRNLPANEGDIRDVGWIPVLGRSPGGGNGNPTPVLLPGELDGQRSLVSYSPWGHKESDTTERINTHTHTHSELFKGKHVN